MWKINRINYLVEHLNIASDAYYGGLEEVMSNYEWDNMFDELLRLEDQTGYILPNSPTRHVSKSSIENGTNKELHEFAALSLAKTKNVNDLQKWAGDFDVWLSWKLDGLTLVLTYDKGILTKILTRGDGHVGTNITFMKQAIRGFPLKISYSGHLVVRGEAIISYHDFENVLNSGENKYANPRNLAAGTLGLDSSKLDLVKERHIMFIAFSLVYVDDIILSWGERMDFLDDLGFCTVERELTTSIDLPKVVKNWTNKVEAKNIDFPVDGLVICYDDTEYATTGSITEHHATRAGLAFKWQDSIAIATLDHIEWSCGTSNITPVAVFEPVQLEGTTVSRASLCNISEMERLGIGENQHTILKIIKSNKIIPKCVGIVEAKGKFNIPTVCPVCGMNTIVKENERSSIKTLHCINVNCPAKHLRRFVRFVSRQGVDIDGLSIHSLLAFINNGLIKDYKDIYHLSEQKNIIIRLDGFGDKSCENLFSAIERSRKVKPTNFIYALSIPHIGTDAAKKIIQKIGFGGFIERLNSKTGFEDIDGIGPERSSSIISWFNVPENSKSLNDLLVEVVIDNFDLHYSQNGLCGGKVFVITGNVVIFENREKIKKYIETQGGRVTSTVTNKTDYLIANDFNSTSAKSENAKKLGIPIISEQDFLKLFCDKNFIMNIMKKQEQI